MRKMMSRALVATFIGLTGVVAVATPAQAIWSQSSIRYSSEEACHTAGSKYADHYCTAAWYPENCGRCGTRVWYLHFWIN